MSGRFLLEAALRIRNAPEFAEFRQWLDAEQSLALKVLTSSQTDNQMYAAQGAYNQITRLKDLIENAPTALDKQPRQ